MTRTAPDVGEQIEQLLGALPPGRNREITEELVRLVVGMYGDGLTRLVSQLDPDTVRRLAEDELIGNLLLLHDLHPVDVDTRIQRALDRVRPYLGSHAGGVEYLGVDADGVAQLRLQGNCDGCPSSTLTVSMAIETALQTAAPELTGVAVQGVQAPEPSGLLQVGMGPPTGWYPPEDGCPVPDPGQQAGSPR